MGWAVLHGSLAWSVVLPLYLAGIAWTLHYDTIYAHQDKKDDIRVGVKSTALTFGERTKKYLIAFSTFFISAAALAGYNAMVRSLHSISTRNTRLTTKG